MRGKSASIIAVLALAAAAAAQPTAMTYQGRLKDGGQPASGTYDFRFRLFDAAQGGNQLGETMCLDNQAVADGLFTTSLDFGQQFASPDQRFLDIQVRADTGLGCGSGNGFVSLKPRQPLTAAPLASHANSAFALDAADGGPTDAVFVDAEGKVGIGTSTPQATIELLANRDGDTPGEGIRIQGTSGGVDNVSYISFLNGSGARTGYVGDGGGSDNSVFLNSDFGDVVLYSANSGAVLTAKANGRVGIGTTEPLAKLDVRGDIRFGPQGQYLAPGAEEDLRIIRGTVASDGSTIVGSGFSCSHLGKGHYLIAFSKPFAQTPTITITADYIPSNDAWFAEADNVSATSSEAYMTGFNFGASDRAFHFIAIGPR